MDRVDGLVLLDGESGEETVLVSDQFCVDFRLDLG